MGLKAKTLIVQLPLAGRSPLKLSSDGAAPAPPFGHVVDAVPLVNRPAGMMSAIDAPVRGTGFGLVMVMVMVESWLTLTTGGENDFVIVGGRRVAAKIGIKASMSSSEMVPAARLERLAVEAHPALDDSPDSVHRPSHARAQLRLA